MTYNMIKNQLFLHQAIDYSQIYNFTLDYDYKFKTIIMFKNVWISKSKSVYVSLFFECSNTWIPSCEIY
jgi:IS4 transposase